METSLSLSFKLLNSITISSFIFCRLPDTIRLSEVVVTIPLTLLVSLMIDESIITYVKRTYNLVIGQKTAQALKEKLGSGIPGNTETMVIVGRDVVSGLPIEMEITGEVV